MKPGNMNIHTIKDFFGWQRMVTFLLIFILQGVASFASDTSQVFISYDKVVTDPSKGVNPYSRWAVFPGKDFPVRKATLYVKFGCPDSMRCADWDYSDRIVLKRQGGKGAPILDYTIAQMLTPYGGAFSKEWNFQWQVDLTDFTLLLRDSVEIEYIHSGYEENKDRGWKIQLHFSFIKGPVVAMPLALHKVYNAGFHYGDAAAPIENELKPYTFKPKEKSTTARLYVLQTGHGMDSNGCGEFCKRFREIWWNNKLVRKTDLWKKCGANPLYPQAGTWVIDRANWCPGYLNQPEIIDERLVAKQDNVFDIQMEQYQTNDRNVIENIFAYLIEYGSPVSKVDASLEEVVVPSTTDIYRRKNPACINPVVVVKNNGSVNLTSCVFRYGTKGFPTREYKWKGNLPFGQTEQITLPGIIDGKNGQNEFTVSIEQPNGAKDGYLADNKAISYFQSVPVHDNKIIIQFRTNNRPADNSYRIINATGKPVFERRLGSLIKDTLYSDTISLETGCYRYDMLDTAGNGLEFWYAVRAGRGTCRILNAKGEMLKNFESDFGNGVSYEFMVSPDKQQWSKPSGEIAVGLFPTMTKGKVVMDYFSNEAQDALVQIIADGGNNEVVEEHRYPGLKEASFQYDLSYRPPQRYYLKVFVKGRLVFNKRIRVVQRVPGE
jgi:hypothetical protein